MINTIRVELLKLFTVRSTYFIIIITFGLMILTGGYIEGYQAPAPELANPKHFVDSVISGKVTIVAIFAAIMSLMLFAHEYRYNTIMYTLTTVRSRTKFLLGKILASTIFGAIFLTVSVAVALLACIIGVKLAGHNLVAQTLPSTDLILRLLLYVWCFSMLGLLFVAITRNQVFSLVGFLLFPNTIEPLLGLLLKTKAAYLPYAAIDATVNNNPNISHSGAVITSFIYIVGLWIIAWVLFLRRDAN